MNNTLFPQKAIVIYLILVISTISYIARAEILEGRYWFDEDFHNYHNCQLDTKYGTLTVSTEGVSTRAVNRIFFQIKSQDGEWSPVYSHFFNSRSSDLNLKYFIDCERTLHPFNSNTKPGISHLTDGFHKITIVESNGRLTPCNELFYKIISYEDQLILSLESSRNRFKKEERLSITQKIVTPEVSELQPGYYPLAVVLKNVTDGSPIAMTNTLVNIKPSGGERITDLVYWLDDSTSTYNDCTITDGLMPLNYNGDLDISNLNIKTVDYKLSVDDNTVWLSPNHTIYVAPKSNRSYMPVVNSRVTDNSKRHRMQAAVLESGIQYDYGIVEHDSCYWAQFYAQSGDEVLFMPRWQSTAIFFNNRAEPFDTVRFSNSAKNELISLRTAPSDTINPGNSGDSDKPVKGFRFVANSTGTYVVQLKDIQDWTQDFSVMMKFLSGPSLNDKINDPDNPKYPGILIDWESANEWNTNSNGIDYTKEGINLTLFSSSSQVQPYVSSKNNLCRVYDGNSIIFDSPNRIERVTICLSKPDKYNWPRLTTNEGKIAIDTLKNIIVWEGFSNTAQIYVKGIIDNPEPNVSELLIEKAYVLLTSIDENSFSFIEPESFENIDYKIYNRMRVWENNRMSGEYLLSQKTTVQFDESNLIITDLEGTHRHTLSNNPIIALDYHNISEIKDVSTDKPDIDLSNGYITISNLPNYVGIYSLDGRTLFYEYIDSPNFTYPMDRLIPGIYIVTVGKSSTKILIK